MFERQLGKEVLKSTVESGYVGYEGDGFTTKDSLEGIVKFTGDDLDSKVDWGRSVATAGACPLLRRCAQAAEGDDFQSRQRFR